MRWAMRNCPHPENAWAISDPGMKACTACGTRRVTDYRALGRAPDLPEWTHHDAPAVAPAGERKQRYSELRHRIHEANRRSARGRS
ncbi:DUF6255 family natural product biosynthesis protein [Streptomyces alboverticillatus]